MARTAVMLGIFLRTDGRGKRASVRSGGIVFTGIVSDPTELRTSRMERVREDLPLSNE